MSCLFVSLSPSSPHQVFIFKSSDDRCKEGEYTGNIMLLSLMLGIMSRLREFPMLHYEQNVHLGFCMVVSLVFFVWVGFFCLFGVLFFCLFVWGGFAFVCLSVCFIKIINPI